MNELFCLLFSSRGQSLKSNVSWSVRVDFIETHCPGNISPEIKKEKYKKLHFALSNWSMEHFRLLLFSFALYIQLFI